MPVSPANPIIAAGNSLTFSLPGSPSPMWSVSSATGVSINSTSGQLTVQSSAPAGTTAKVTATDASGSYDTWITVAPAGAMNGKNLLIYGTDGKLYLLSGVGTSLSSLMQVAQNAVPQAILDNNGGNQPIGQVAPPASVFNPYPGVNYITCVVANMQADYWIVGMAGKEHHKKA